MKPRVNQDAFPNNGFNTPIYMQSNVIETLIGQTNGQKKHVEI